MVWKKWFIRFVAIMLVSSSIWLTWRWFDSSVWLSDMKLLAGQPLWLIFMFTVYLGSFLLKTAAWRMYTGAHVKFSILFHAISYSLLVNHLLPVKVGDAVRSGVYMKHSGTSWDEALHSVAVMRLLDMLVLGAIGGTGILSLGLSSSWIWITLLAGGAGVLAVARYVPFIRNIAFVRKHSDYFQSRMLSGQGLCILALITLSWVMEAGVIYAVAKMLALPLGGASLIWVNSMTIAGQIFHITPGGIGTYESTMSGSLTLLGVTGEQAFQAALVSHTFKFGFAYVIGAYSFVRLPLNWREMRRWIMVRKDNEMKKASSFEIIAARCWNMLNEGKPFTPIFVVGVFLLYHCGSWTDSHFWSSAGLGLLVTLPLFVIYYCFDFPLFLRNYLWFPLIAAILIWDRSDMGLYVLALALFYFFTVYFWGTFYYHLRIGTTWWNFTRFWKLVLKNSDSTSGNAQEQMPKFLLLLFVWNQYTGQFGSSVSADVWTVLLFAACVWLYSYILHRNLFDWKPAEIPTYTRDTFAGAGHSLQAINKKVIVIVIDGMRKERFEDADAPFLKKLRAEGTEYSQMETVYPARTVVCFSSMFTGTYPREHGIRSNMVWRLGIRVESIFDSLRKVGRKGRLLGIAHLIDSMGDDVESVTAVMHNDVADRNIIERAKKIMEEQNPDLLVAQLIGVDQTGHSRGVLYEDYTRKIAEADRLIEQFVSWLESRGMMDNTTLIICADHGQADGIGGHGHLDEGERYVPFFLHGPTIRPGHRIDDKHSLVSMAPTLAYLLGAPFPSHSRGPVLTEAFKPHE